MPSTGTATSDHPVFKRLSRDQLVARRRNIGYQTLIFQSSLPRAERCKHCGRRFNSVWKEYLCHVCGLWVCQPCSLVLERERVLQYVTFMRSCVGCLLMLNKWADTIRLTEFAMHPWVVSSSKRQISLTLSDALRTKKESRRAVLLLLNQLGMPVDPNDSFLDGIHEDDWVAATTEGSVGVSQSPEAHENAVKTSVECVQHLVQQCFDVVIPELALKDCVFAESDGIRHYALQYNSPDQPPESPPVPDEDKRLHTLAGYGQVLRSLNTPLLQLICDLVAKELEAWSSFITMVKAKVQFMVAAPPGCPCSTALKRSECFCSFALTSSRPFLIRDTSMDIRFRNIEIARGGQLMFYIAFPIVDEAGVTVAFLCALDHKPRKCVTTMQYSVMKRLAAVVSALWKDIVNQNEL
ncbi:hypothetical protein Poli38472_012143 [Pythium oligandrum]|uniref:FYVE-type domain-containing protein n=1 Tax=Pythium oligandrum TaxID=41045 RepID=A0A8K1CNX1_PYTOL|nr:hypothetical protein Poli38472_012143 [Pythium oligandrum]|eukprot:TMW67027.1 hypothetical protein Poli38472_012143 [Pythium oligandrum]